MHTDAFFGGLNEKLLYKGRDRTVVLVGRSHCRRLLRSLPRARHLRLYQLAENETKTKKRLGSLTSKPFYII